MAEGKTENSGKKLSEDDLNKVVGGVNYNGTSGDDVQSGTMLGDNMNGQGGDDRLFGGFGNDNLTGGDGNDALHGGYGNDNLDGGDGNDRMFGGAGSDHMTGGEGNDYMDGGKDDGMSDVAIGGEGNDQYMWGMGDGSDYFDGGVGGEDYLVITDLGDASSLRDAVENHGWTIQVTLDGQTFNLADLPPEVANQFWNGDNALAAGYNGAEFGGVLTSPSGETMTFENITELSFQPGLDAR